MLEIDEHITSAKKLQEAGINIPAWVGARGSIATLTFFYAGWFHTIRGTDFSTFSPQAKFILQSLS